MTLFPLEQAPAASNSADTSSSIKPKPTEPLSPDAIPTSKQSEEEEAPVDTSLNGTWASGEAIPVPGHDSVSVSSRRTRPRRSRSRSADKLRQAQAHR
jgi:hypothetical protein